jgi:DNA-binding XRE family transcriptional regulator
MIDEIWKPVEDFPDYQVSNLGRIKSVKYGKERFISGSRNPKGYVRIYLRGKIRDRKKFLHVLVLEAFVGPRPEGYEAGHLDNDTENNDVTNLAWVTPSENTLMNYHVFNNSSQAKITLNDAREIRRLYATGGYKQKELAKMYGIAQSAISKIINEIHWKE